MLVKDTVLLVDDEPQVLVALEDLLSDDYQVVRADSAARALSVLAQQPEIAVVVTDQRMPRMTGDELLAELGDSSDAARILLTGFADLSAVIRAVNEGRIFAYVTKPWDDDDLRLKVSRAVQYAHLARELVEERRLLQGLMDSVSDGIYFKDAELRFLRVNRAFARSLGAASPSELIGRRLSEAAPGIESEAAEREEARVLSGDQSAEDALRRVVSAGGSRWFSENRARILNYAGKVAGIVGIARDVTERVRGDEALRRSEARYREQTQVLNSVLSGMGDGVVVLDRSGRFLLFNRRAEKILGIGARDVEPASLGETYGLWRRDTMTPLTSDENPLLRAMSGEELSEAEVFIKNATVRGANVAVTATPLRDDHGNLRGSIALLRDVTSQRQLEQKLLQSQKMEAIGRLAGSVAHDFNNLLSVILSYSSLVLSELPSNAPARADIEAIRHAGERACDLTRQLLAFGRSQAVAPRVVDVNATLVDTRKILQRLMGESVELTFRLDDGACCVRADPVQIEQVVVNLAVNARDAMPEGGKLHIATSTVEVAPAESDEWKGVKPGRYLMLSVSDTGSGMDASTLEQIFEPFFTTKELGKGTGLGLATVQSIVKQSEGHIAVESELSQGTRFKVLFPATDDVQAQGEAAQAPISLDGSETILLVEPQDDVRRAAAHVLRRRGYLVLEARNPREALLTCESARTPIHLLLTDMVMPPVSGHELAERLRALRPTMQVLVMSGYLEGAVLGTDDQSAEHYLRKPFTAEGLSRRVREVLEGSERHTLH